MTTREIKIEDIEIVSKLFDSYRIFYGKEPDLEGSKQFLLQRIKNKESKIFVAENTKNALTGFVQLYPVFSSTRLKRLWLLNDLFVDEQFRGRGISVLLINEAKNLCKATDACGIILETAQSNVVGNKLYPKTGFSLDAEHNYYFWDIN